MRNVEKRTVPFITLWLDLHAAFAAAPAGCGPGAAPTRRRPPRHQCTVPRAGSSATAAPTAGRLASPAAAGFPLTITDSAGRKVTIAKAPQRIVSLAPSATEIVFALGLEQAGAVDNYSDFPAEAKALPKIGDQKINLEQVVAQTPGPGAGRRHQRAGRDPEACRSEIDGGRRRQRKLDDGQHPERHRVGGQGERGKRAGAAGDRRHEAETGRPEGKGRCRQNEAEGLLGTGRQRPDQAVHRRAGRFCKRDHHAGRRPERVREEHDALRADQLGTGGAGEPRCHHHERRRLRRQPGVAVEGAQRLERACTP